jgi:hypothetical protein
VDSSTPVDVAGSDCAVAGTPPLDIQNRREGAAGGNGCDLTSGRGGGERLRYMGLGPNQPHATDLMYREASPRDISPREIRRPGKNGS